MARHILPPITALSDSDDDTPAPRPKGKAKAKAKGLEPKAKPTPKPKNEKSTKHPKMESEENKEPEETPTKASMFLATMLSKLEKLPTPYIAPESSKPPEPHPPKGLGDHQQEPVEAAEETADSAVDTDAHVKVASKAVELAWRGRAAKGKRC
eukprot:s2422_g1.t1